MNNKLYVGNLSYSVRDNDLQDQFAPFGEVLSAKVMMERESNRSKGFGFVEMATAEQAQAAIEALHEQPWGGRNLVVNVARPREERPARGFGGGGFGGGGNRGGFGGGNGGGYGGSNGGGRDYY